MLTKVPNSNCFSRVITFFGLLIVFPICFTLSSQASGAADNEREPLLINEHRPNHVAVQLEDGYRSLQQYLADLDVNRIVTPLDPIVVADALKVVNDPKPAELEMNKITEYLAYISDVEFHEEIFAKARKGGYYVEQPDAFKQLLFDRAWTAATEGPLATYLGKVNKVILGLQKVAPELEQRLTVFNQRIDFFVGAIRLIKQKEALARAEQKRQLEELRTCNRRLWIAIPVFAAIAACIAGGVTTPLVHFFWH